MTAPRKKKSESFFRCLIICHGKCEVIMMKDMRSKLRLPIEIYAKENGKSSIQITSVMDLLNSRDFIHPKNLNQFLNGRLSYSKQELYDFKIFIIMDVDEPELTSKQIEEYKSGTMFQNHWLHRYIVPIYNCPNLDYVITNQGYSIDSHNKVASYKKIFPGDRGDIEQFKIIKDKFNLCPHSNMSTLLEYLHSIVEE